MIAVLSPGRVWPGGKAGIESPEYLMQSYCKPMPSVLGAPAVAGLLGVSTFVVLLLATNGCFNSRSSVTVSADASSQGPRNDSPAGTDRQTGSTAESAGGVASITEEEKLTFIHRVKPKVEAFCGDCHAMPHPSGSSHDEWEAEVNQGFMLYGTSGRNDLEVPPYDEVLNYFQYQAPAELKMSDSIRGYPDTSIAFRQSNVRYPGPRPPGITNVRWIDLGMRDTPALVYCDIGTGGVMAHWPSKDIAASDAKSTIRLGTLLQPVHVEPCDLDADGLTDLVVADIGEFNANDSTLGRVVWLRRKPDEEAFERITLADGLARMADVQPGDFDGDGDQDLLVGVFGWRKSGRIFLMKNDGLDESKTPTFSQHEIDPRHGAVNTIPVDLNQDGHLDFVALLSQEHEVVEAFLNDGTGQFSNQVIWAAPIPGYGSSGIELVDMDQDGDLDVLCTNGDSFDRGPKPCHSVQWLENEGTYPYTHHHLCEMPGVLNATAKDFDGDGDLDVAAAALLAGDHAIALNRPEYSSVVMLEQTSPGQFKRTKIEDAFHRHISLEGGDFDGDGKVDLAVGTFLRTSGADQPDLKIWWNR